MILKDLKKRFAVAEYNDLGLRVASDPRYPAIKNLAYVTEFVMHRKTSGKKEVRFRVYLEQKTLRDNPKPGEYRESHELAAVFAVRQILDQL